MSKVKMTNFKLKNVLKFFNGKMRPNSKGNYPLYGGNGIIDYVGEYNYENNIIIGRVGANCGSIQECNNKCWVSDNAISVTVNDNFNKKYIFYLLNLLDLNKKHIGAAQPLITQEIIGNIESLIPLLPVQRKIAAVLTALDDKIALNKRINDKLEAMAKRLYDYWFVQFDFPDENGRPYKFSGGKMVWNEMLKREIPAGWRTDSVFNAYDVIYGYPFSTEGFDEIDLEQSNYSYKVIRIRDIQNNTYSAKTNELVLDKYLTKAGDLLIGMDGYFYMNIWTRDGEYVNQRIARVRQINLSTLLLKYQIAPAIKLKESQSKGSTVGHLSDKDLKGLNVIIPNNNSITKQFDLLSINIIIRKQEIAYLTAHRDRLLPLLMNGQVEVR